MNNEEMKRTMAFIVEQQAQFVTDLQQMKEVQTQFAEETRRQLGNLTEATLGLVGIVSRVAKAQEKTEAKVAALAEKVDALTTSQAHTDERLDALINAQIKADERLNEFMATVQRYINENQNGKSRN